AAGDVGAQPLGQPLVERLRIGGLQAGRGGCHAGEPSTANSSVQIGEATKLAYRRAAAYLVGGWVATVSSAARSAPACPAPARPAPTRIPHAPRSLLQHPQVDR